MSLELSDYHRLIALKNLPEDELYSPCKAKEGYYSSLLKKVLREPFAVDDSGNPVAAPPASKAEKIKASFEKLLEANLLGDHDLIDASKAELYHMGVSRDRIDARLISIWAKTHGYDISSGGGNNIKRGRVYGKAKSSGLRQQIPGFGLDKELHLLAADAGAGKTTAAAELAVIYSTCKEGFLDHQAPRTDPPEDPRKTSLVIASDGDGSAHDMWCEYLQEVGADERDCCIEIWAQDDDKGEQPWNVCLPNLERLATRLEQGDIAVVIIDTANAIFRGAAVNAGIGPVEEYLRLLKQIVCRHCALWILHHTNRLKTADMKSIGGHPAFQEVPSVVHLIELSEGRDGSKTRIWHVLKLRGSEGRRISYTLKEGRLKVTQCHYFENCSDEVLVAIHKQHQLKAEGRTAQTNASEIALLTGRPIQSVSNALNLLKGDGKIRKKGSGYILSESGKLKEQGMRINT